MADQGKWWKLWTSSLNDDDLENLSIHEWFCWVRFGAHMKSHGKDGKIRLRYPATAVVNLMRVPNFEEVVSMIKKFPNYVVEEAQDVTVSARYMGDCTINIKVRNWNKYQGDYSVSRVRKHRLLTKLNVTANVTAQEEKRGEEKRRDTTPPIGPPRGTRYGWFETVWKTYPKPIGKKAALRHFEASVKTQEDFNAIQRALRKYMDSKECKDGFIKNASTWFNQWKDWLEVDDGRHDREGVSELATFVSRAREARRIQGLRKVSEATALPVRIRDATVDQEQLPPVPSEATPTTRD